MGLLAMIFPPASKFNTQDVPDLTGKVMIVTGRSFVVTSNARWRTFTGSKYPGGSSGIGKETVRALLEHNAKVYIATRNADKAKLVIEELKNEVGKEAQFLQLDLSSLKDTRHAAEEFLRKEKELHVLYNNA